MKLDNQIPEGFRHIVTSIAAPITTGWMPSGDDAFTAKTAGADELHRHTVSSLLELSMPRPILAEKFIHSAFRSLAGATGDPLRRTRSRGQELCQAQDFLANISAVRPVLCSA